MKIEIELHLASRKKVPTRPEQKSDMISLTLGSFTE